METTMKRTDEPATPIKYAWFNIINCQLTVIDVTDMEQWMRICHKRQQRQSSTIMTLIEVT